MSVQAISEALDTVVVGHAGPLERLESGEYRRGLEWIGVSDSDRETIALQMPSAKLVLMASRPEHLDVRVSRLDTARVIVRKVDRDHLVVQDHQAVEEDADEVKSTG